MMKDIDIRVRMAVMLLIAIGILIFKTEYAVYACLAFATIWTGLILGIKKVVPQLFLFVSLELILWLIKDVKALANLPLLLIYLRRLVIAIMTAYPVAKAPVGKLIASLDKLKVPRTITISLAVLFRFMPTVSMEYSAIRQAQKYRGIGIRSGRMIGQLPRLFEYTMVPLLIRTTKVADELTASAEVRGMKLSGEYNPYYEVKMRAMDLLALFISVSYIAGVGYMDFTNSFVKLFG